MSAPFAARILRSDIGRDKGFRRWALYLGNDHVADIVGQDLGILGTSVSIRTARGRVLLSRRKRNPPLPQVPRHLYATAWGGADQTPEGEPTTLCGLVKATVRTVHSSKARKTDCRDCRRILRERIWDARRAACLRLAELKGRLP